MVDRVYHQRYNTHMSKTNTQRNARKPVLVAYDVTYRSGGSQRFEYTDLRIATRAYIALANRSNVLSIVERVTAAGELARRNA